MKHSANKGGAIAAAVLGLVLATGCGGDDDEKAGASADAIKCLGGNECKGMSECAGGPTSNQCKGLNECMGTGWDYKETAEACEEAGGMVAPS